MATTESELKRHSWDNAAHKQASRTTITSLPTRSSGALRTTSPLKMRRFWTSNATTEESSWLAFLNSSNWLSILRLTATPAPKKTSQSPCPSTTEPTTPVSSTTSRSSTEASATSLTSTSTTEKSALPSSSTATDQRITCLNLNSGKSTRLKPQALVSEAWLSTVVQLQELLCVWNNLQPLTNHDTLSCP